MSNDADGSGRRERSPRGQGEQLRREILDAVARLLDEWGSAEKLTMRAVAREAGVAAPSIYLHFSDKADLVWAALEDKYADLAARMRAGDARAAEAGLLARDRLEAQAREYCRFARELPGHYRLMYETRQPQVTMSRLHRHPSRHISHSLRQGFALCRAAGHPVSLPDEQAAQTLWAGLHGSIALHHALMVDEGAGALTEELAVGLIDSLVPPATTAGPRPPAPDTEAARKIRSILTGDAPEE
ncbi:TetR/AcrR family transcriptional regulator [Streptomyces sp. NPDC091267]|uniref:TetR/AcrR family transcriptional regulator n=1 Tax=unclassified Streptomyces TaxID=2593676 RepID=UPI003415854C